MTNAPAGYNGIVPSELWMNFKTNADYFLDYWNGHVPEKKSVFELTRLAYDFGLSDDHIVTMLTHYYIKNEKLTGTKWFNREDWEAYVKPKAFAASSASKATSPEPCEPSTPIANAAPVESVPWFDEFDSVTLEANLKDPITSRRILQFLLGKTDTHIQEIIRVLDDLRLLPVQQQLDILVREGAIEVSDGYYNLKSREDKPVVAKIQAIKRLEEDIRLRKKELAVLEAKLKLLAH